MPAREELMQGALRSRLEQGETETGVEELHGGGLLRFIRE